MNIPDSLPATPHSALPDLSRPTIRTLLSWRNLPSRCRPVFTASLAAMVAFSFEGCRRPPAEKVVVTGASTVYPIVQMAGEELHRTKGLDVSAQAGGSTRGFEDCVAGRNTLGAMARELSAEEKAQVMVFPIAYDAVGITVHATNQLPAVTTEDLQQIYRKKITNWSHFGGPDLPIVVVHKGEGHATRDVFRKYTGLTPEEMTQYTDVVAGDNAQVIRVIANTTGAIGYVSLGEVIKAAESGLAVRLVKLNGIEPLMENVTNKTYPITHPLFLISKKEPTGGNRVLLDFLRAPEGKAIIRQGNYVPLE